METIQLRAHHGMCLAFFQGQGYSSDFTAHMAKIMRLMRENPTIQLVCHSDIICDKCPNLIRSHRKCNTASFVKQCDLMVLSLCGLQENTIMQWDPFFRLVCERILVPGKRPVICGQCQWNDICNDSDINIYLMK